MAIWDDDQPDIAVSGRLFDITGRPIGDQFVVATAPNSNVQPGVAALPGNGFVVVWGHRSPLYARIYDGLANPIGADILVGGGEATQIQVSAQSTGGFIVTWDDEASPVDDDIFARVYSAGGVALGPQFLVNSYTTGEQDYPDVAVLDDDGFVIVWDSIGGDDIRGQRFDSVGTPVGTEFAVNTYTTNQQLKADVAAIPGGGFVIAWGEGSHGYGGGVAARIYDAAGDPISSEISVGDPSSPTAETRPGVAVSSTGDIAIAWADDSLDVIRVRRLNSSGVPLHNPITVSAYPATGAQEPELTIDRSSGTLFSAWQSFLQDGDSFGIYVARICIDDGPDFDGDAIGDLCDVCTSISLPALAVKPKLRFKFVVFDSVRDNDAFAFRGEFALPVGVTFEDIDPLARPVRMRVEADDARTLMDVEFPGAVFGNGTKLGWKLNGAGTKWSYADKSARPPAGIVRLQLQDRSSREPGQVRVLAKGRRGTYGLEDRTTTTQLSIAVGDGTVGECAETGFSTADCGFKGVSPTFTCAQ